MMSSGEQRLRNFAISQLQNRGIWDNTFPQDVSNLFVQYSDSLAIFSAPWRAIQYRSKISPSSSTKKKIECVEMNRIAYIARSWYHSVPNLFFYVDFSEVRLQFKKESFYPSLWKILLLHHQNNTTMAKCSICHEDCVIIVEQEE